MADPRAGGWARAIFEMARAEGVIETVRDELLVFRQALVAEPDLRDALADPGKEAANKATLITNLLGGKSNPLTARTLSLIAFQGRARELVEIIDDFVERVASEQGASVAEVRSAVPLDDSQVAAITKVLGEVTGRPVEVNVLVDPSIVGGIVARVGDQVFDSSVKRRLSVLREKIGNR